MASQKAEHPIRNGVIVTVVGGLVLAGLSYFIPSVWIFSKLASAWIWNTATFRMGIPMWLLCALVFMALPALVQIWKAIRGPTWSDYKEDEFDGILWRWAWTSKRLVKLCCYCPQDDTELVPSEYENPFGGTQLELHCETCDSKFGPLEGKYSKLRATIERQIERKVRNDQWQRVSSGE